MRSLGQTGRVESLELVLGGDGVPRSMVVSGSGPTLATGDETFRLSMTFSDVGAPVTITAPRR
jgi:hypothetical protein